MKRKFLYTVIAAAVILIGSLTFCGVNFLKAAFHGEAVLEKVGKKFDTTPSLGTLFNLETACALPWGQDIDSIDLLPGEGLILQDEIKTANRQYTLKGRKKVITIPLKSYRTGKLEPGTLHLTIKRNMHNSAVKKQTLTLKLPTVEISPLKVENPNQLPLADKAVKKPGKTRKIRYWLIISAVILSAAAVILIILLKRRKKHTQEILPPWVVARRNLEELRKTADENKQPLEWCVARLSDVVREYLSIRFCWRVKQQTTEEFFASLKRKSSPLTTTQTFYLEEFMKQSDLIKFANIKPDKDAFAQAVNRAGELVDQTGEAETDSSRNQGSEVKK